MSCPRCAPELNPQGPRRGEHHLAVRFGKTDWKLFVRKNGRIIKDCYEVDVDAGLAWRTLDPIQRCEQCGYGIESYIDRGLFTVSTT